METIQNPPLASLRAAMLASASGKAEDLGLPALRRKDKTRVAAGVGKRGRAHRRIINYKRTGPFYRQVGVKVVADKYLPLMQVYYKHRFLHATKGWREYHGGPALTLPRGPAPNYYPRLVFYGRAHR